MTCPRCGAAQDADARFCKSCGAALAAPAAPPPAPPPATVPPPAVPMAAPPPAPRAGMPGWLVGCLVALVLVLIVAASVAGVLVYRSMPHGAAPLPTTVQSADKPDATAGEKTDDKPVTDPSDIEPDEVRGSDKPLPEPADPQAEARATLDGYIAAERARNSPKMATFLTGDAAAKFDATQTAHDTDIKSVRVAETEVVDNETVVFKVEMGAADLESGEAYLMKITYRVIKTENGWKISSIRYQE